MRGVRCRTKRAPIETQLEAAAIAAGVAKGAEAVQCPYCGWWHVVLRLVARRRIWLTN
jgi:hypothetical protein